MSEVIRVTVTDDHELFRRGLLEILREEPGFVVVGEASNGQEAIKMCLAEKPDVAIMDIHMPVSDGVDAVRVLKKETDIRILMLTVSDKDEDLLSALSAGADGYLLKNTRPDALCDAVRKIASGHGVLAPEVTPMIMREAVRPARRDLSKVKLSNREREVIQLLSQGATTHKIAAELFLSENTIKTHVKRILKKLNASNRTEAVAWAISLGLIEPS